MARPGGQQALFDVPARMPNGFVYRPDFLTPEEEEITLAYIENLPLERAEYDVPAPGEKLRVASKRRHFGFGWGYDFRTQRFVEGPPLPDFLKPAQRKIAKWLDIAPARVVEALINEYTPGSAIGWHRDREEFEHIVGLSLKGWARMRFRPLKSIGDTKSVISFEVEPRSAYIMQKEVRWEWQHSVAPTKTLRYSITFRTLPARGVKRALKQNRPG